MKPSLKPYVPSSTIPQHTSVRHPHVCDSVTAPIVLTVQLLGDGLCWVYDPPIRLYDELSIFDLHSLSTHLLLTARYSLHTHVAHARVLTSFRSCSGSTSVADLLSKSPLEYFDLISVLTPIYILAVSS